MHLILALASLLLLVPAAPASAQNNQTQSNQRPAITAGGRVTANYGSMTSEGKAAFSKQLVDSLLAAPGDKGGSVVGPGANHQVGEAVTAIAQGASDGDKRLQEALNLLAAGSVAQATPLLQA